MSDVEGCSGDTGLPATVFRQVFDKGNDSDDTISLGIKLTEKCIQVCVELVASGVITPLLRIALAGMRYYYSEGHPFVHWPYA
jgi:hypothetical protein